MQFNDVKDYYAILSQLVLGFITIFYLVRLTTRHIIISTMIVIVIGGLIVLYYTPSDIQDEIINKLNFSKLKTTTPSHAMSKCQGTDKVLRYILNTFDINIKRGVDVSRICDDISYKLPLIQQIFKKHQGLPLVITSGNDGVHSANSKHYLNRAIDLRIKHLSRSQQRKISQDLEKHLGDDWQVLYGDSLHMDYIHLSYLGKIKSYKKTNHHIHHSRRTRFASN